MESLWKIVNERWKSTMNICGELYKLQAYKLPVKDRTEIGIKLERFFSRILLAGFFFKKGGIRINLNAD